MKQIEIQDIPLWDKKRKKQAPFSWDMELTARCNNNCRHCYINLPVNDRQAKRAELSLSEIEKIADETIELGALWCTITGGEPLLRDDFEDIYLMLKKKGVLLNVFTNATLIRDNHIRLFEKYPPRDIEITIYGAVKKTYDRVTRRPGSFDSFKRGIDMLSKAGIPFRFKAMAMCSTFGEKEQIKAFGRQYTKDYFRFDGRLYLRFDRDPKRNAEIMEERLTPEQYGTLEKTDRAEHNAMRGNRDKLFLNDIPNGDPTALFSCGAGAGSFNVGYDGKIRLCSRLWHRDCVYDWRSGSVIDFLSNHVEKVRAMRSKRRQFLDKCRKCRLINLCMWCPAGSDLETGELDLPVDYFCDMAEAKEKMIKGK